MGVPVNAPTHPGPSRPDTTRPGLAGPPTPGEVLDAARSQLGVSDGPGRPTGYLAWLRAWTGGAPAHDRWAPAFCAWALACAGMGPADGGRFANCTPWAAWFQSLGRLAHSPVPGALVFFDWDADGRPEHVGFVEALHHDGRLLTIEGDVEHGDGRPASVHRMMRSRRAVHGYGLPFYGPARRLGGQW